MSTAGSDDSPPERRPVQGRTQWNGKITTLVLAPLLLVILLTGGMRLIAHFAQAAADREEAAAYGYYRAASQRPANGTPKKRQKPRYVPTTADRATQKALEACVRSQVQAISRSDFNTALRFATRQFRDSISPEHFGQMVTNGYPVMVEARSVTFEPAMTVGSAMANIRVHISGASGAESAYIYQMMQDEEGNWGVSSVAPIGPPSQYDPRRGGPASGGKAMPFQPGRMSPPMDLRDV